MKTSILHRREIWKGRRKACREMLKAAGHPSPVLVIKLPIVGLCEAFCCDGKAWLFPGTGDPLIVDWSQMIRYYHRHAND